MQRVRRRILWALMLVLGSIALVVGPMAVQTIAAGPPPKLHGAVQAYAKAHPGETIPVIIQKESADRPIEDEVVKKGGRVKRNLALIKGVAAEVPASALDALASHPGVRWISYDAPVFVNAAPVIDTGALATAYPWAVGAPDVWNGAPSYTGAGITVAVVDSGINTSATSGGNKDYGPRVIASAGFSAGSSTVQDKYGHGTHVAGIIAGDGSSLKSAKYIGIAPRANLINVKVSDDAGAALTSNVIEGLQWIDDHNQSQSKYKIQVVNVSLNSSVPQSYLTDPLDAAVEQLWFHGAVVVVSAGNLGTAPDAVSYAPANDPYVIVVGALDDKGTPSVTDDAVTSWSSRGVTQDGISRPDVWAPGSRIVSTIFPGAVLPKAYPKNMVDKFYFRMGGTSMSSAVASGVVALARQAHPSWTPNQVKWALMNTGSPLSTTSGINEVSASGIVGYGGTPQSANQGNIPSLQIDVATGNVIYDSVTWDSVTWDSVTWDAMVNR